MVEYEEYVRRFASQGATVLTTKDEFEAGVKALKEAKKNYCNVKFRIKASCCDKPFESTWGGFDNKESKKCSDCNLAAYYASKRETYDSCVIKFREHGAELLTTREEYEADPTKGLSRFLFRIKAKCGHERNTKYHNFVGTGDAHGVCMSCASKQRMSSEEDNRFDQVAAWIRGVLEDFEFDTLEEGCKADFAIKPKTITEDLWAGGYLKPVKKTGTKYSLSLKKDYTGSILIVAADLDKKVWLIDPEAVKDYNGITISQKSKYNDYETSPEDLPSKIAELYAKADKLPLEELRKKEPKEYTYTREISYETIKNNIEKTGATLLTSEEEYKAAKGPLNSVKFDIKARCSHNRTITYYSFINSEERLQQCLECNDKNRLAMMSETLRMSYEDVKKRFEELGARLVTTEQEFVENKMLVGHDKFLIVPQNCSHEFEVRYGDYKESQFRMCTGCARFAKNNGNLSYEDMLERFAKFGLKLETTKEDFLNNKMNTYSEYRFVATCGHERTGIYNNITFKENMLCIACSRAAETAKKIESAKKDGVVNAHVLEYESICFVRDLIKDVFEVEVMDEGCKADLAIKPKFVTENEWIGVQLKATKQSVNDKKYEYSFSCKKDYTGMVLLFLCPKDSRIWMIDPEVAKQVTGMQIVDKEGTKYYKYKVNPNDLAGILMDSYNEFEKSDFNHLNLPVTDTHKQEQEFRKHREKKLGFITFERPHMNCMVYDFKVNGFTVQEKVSRDENRFSLHKSAGVKKKQPYDKHDNDFYWLNMKDKKTFYVVPEKVLIDNGYVSNGDQKGKIELRSNKEWLKEYKFEYDNINKDKLLNMFGL